MRALRLASAALALLCFSLGAAAAPTALQPENKHLQLSIGKHPHAAAHAAAQPALSSSNATTVHYASASLHNCRCGGKAVCSRDDVAFVHIPKTGGETIEYLLQITKDHCTADDRQLQPGGPKLILSIKRNPYDRIYSWFKFCIHGWYGKLPQPDKVCGSAVGIFNKAPEDAALSDWQRMFASWLSEITPFLAAERKGANAEGWLGCNSVPGQGYYFSLTAADYLLQHNTSRYIPDFTIRFEHYEEDLAVLLQCLHMPSGEHGGTGTHENNSEEADDLQPLVRDSRAKFERLTRYSRQETYTTEALQWVDRWYGSDFAPFGYAHETSLL